MPLHLSQGVICLAVECPGAVVPEGECCPVCPNGEGEGVYIHMARMNSLWLEHIHSLNHHELFGMVFIQCVSTTDKLTIQVIPFLHLTGVTHGECESNVYILSSCSISAVTSYIYSLSECSFCSAGGLVACTEKACVQKCKHSLLMGCMHLLIITQLALYNKRVCTIMYL